MGHAGMAHALRGLRAPGLPGVSVPSVFENSVLSVFILRGLRAPGLPGVSVPSVF